MDTQWEKGHTRRSPAEHRLSCPLGWPWKASPVAGPQPELLSFHPLLLVCHQVQVCMGMVVLPSPACVESKGPWEDCGYPGGRHWCAQWKQSLFRPEAHREVA